MRVLNFSLDKQVLEKGSAVQRRLLVLAEKAGELVVFAPAEKGGTRVLSPHLTVHAAGGPKIIQFFKLWNMAGRVLRALESDLITVQDTGYLAVLAYFLARRFKVPFEIQVHGLERFYGVRKRLAGFVLRRSDKIRVVGERMKREILSRFPLLPASRVYVLPVYTQVRDSDRQGPTLYKGTGPAFTFLAVSRLAPVKNIGMQIRAMSRLVREYPQARLTIVGDGPLLADLKLLVADLQLEAVVYFGGRQEDLARYYREADAFLLTSDAEGWGLAVTEAAAYALPIIMTDVGLAGEFVRNRESGLVIPVGDEEALVSAMRTLIADAGLRARLGEGARRSFLALPGSDEQTQEQIAHWRGLK